MGVSRGTNGRLAGGQVFLRAERIAVNLDGGYSEIARHDGLLRRRIRRDLNELVYRIAHYRSPFSRLSKSTAVTECHVFAGGTGAVATNVISLAFLLRLVRPGYVTHSMATFKSMITLPASMIVPSK